MADTLAGTLLGFHVDFNLHSGREIPIFISSMPIEWVRSADDCELQFVRKEELERRLKRRELIQAYPEHLIIYFNPFKRMFVTREDHVYGFSDSYLCPPCFVSVPTIPLIESPGSPEDSELEEKDEEEECEESEEEEDWEPLDLDKSPFE